MDFNAGSEREAERKKREAEAQWYVVHTYSGHENKVKDNIEAMVENRGFKDDIFEVSVPTEEYIETKDGKQVVKERKLFPSYVLIKMIVTDTSWFIVRNTRGVMGFVGPGNKPVPLTEEEVASFGVREVTGPVVDYNVGDNVNIINGPFEGFVGEVEQVIPERTKLKVFVSIFGRETSVELDFTDVEKV